MTTSAATGSVSETFASVLEEKKRAFIPFICAGDPNLDATKKALKVLDDAGADIIELGGRQRPVGGWTGDSSVGDASVGERGDAE